MNAYDEWNQFAGTLQKRPSAVVLLFIEDQNRRDLVFIRRSTRVGSHRGQIGFPGGRAEAEDRSPAETALRELTEEIGVSSRHITVLGRLSEFESIDQSIVVPILATLPAASFSYSINEDEVQKLHLVDWNGAQAPKAERFSFNMFGTWRKSYLYDCGEFKVWGLSAEILSKLPNIEGLVK